MNRQLRSGNVPQRIFTSKYVLRRLTTVLSPFQFKPHYVVTISSRLRTRRDNWRHSSRDNWRYPLRLEVASCENDVW